MHVEKEVMKNRFLEGRICELEKRMGKHRGVAVAKENEGKEEGKTAAQQKSWAVVVRAKRSETDEGVDDRGESGKKDIIKKVEPMLTDVRVRAMKRLKNGNVVMETMSEREARRIKECVREQVRYVTVEDVKTMKPRVLVYDVPSEMSEREVLNELYNKNTREKGVNEEIFMRETKIVF